MNVSNSQNRSIIASNLALLRALRAAGVEFIRFTTVDSSNNLRAKVAPLKRLLKNAADNPRRDPLSNVLSIAQVCFGGLPFFGDLMVAESTLDARSVLVVQPDLSSLRILPYSKTTAMVIGNLHDQKTNTPSPLCTRGILARVIERADQEFGLNFAVGAELEFVLMHNEGHEKLQQEGWAPTPVDASVFANTSLLDDAQDFISDVYKQLEQQDIEIELIHAESANGQLEMVLRYQQDAMKLADNVIFARETIRSVARAHDMRALFLPKVSNMQAGNGMHLHFSFSTTSNPTQNAFTAIPNGSNHPISEMAGSFIEGILQHLPALLALTLPSVNSFRRMGKGCWTGYTVTWNTEDKEVPLRVCLDLATGKATNVEYKLSDSTANIYLEIAAILSAGLDGIAQEQQLRPSSEETGSTTNGELPKTFPEALECLRKSEFFVETLGKELVTNYLALRTAEAKVASAGSIEQEVVAAYLRA